MSNLLLKMLVPVSSIFVLSVIILAAALDGFEQALHIAALSFLCFCAGRWLSKVRREGRR